MVIKSKNDWLVFIICLASVSLLTACFTTPAPRPPAPPASASKVPAQPFNRADFERALAGRDLDMLASYSSQEKGSLGANLNKTDHERATQRYETLRQEILLTPAATAALAPNLPSLAALLAKPEARHFTSTERAKLNSVLTYYAETESPESKYRTDIIDPRISRVSKTQTSSAARDPDNNLKPLVIALLKGENDPFLRVKLIHDWIADTVTYDVSMTTKATITGQDIASVLSSRKAVCSGYARLFEKMAGLAGFDVKTVTGYTKGLGDDFAFNFRDSHAWNMVRIGDLWYFIDTTFDAGAFDIDKGSARYHKRYSTDYLFPSPFQLRFTHFPDNPLYQLSAAPVDKNAFQNQALVLPEFFTNSLTLQRAQNSPMDLASFQYLQKAPGIFSLDIRAPEQMLVDASLFDAQGRELEQYTFASHIAPEDWRLVLVPPSSGMSRVQIFAGQDSLGGDSPSPTTLASVLQFELRKSDTSGKPGGSVQSLQKEPLPFPKIYGRYHKPAGELLESPLAGSLAQGSTAHFVYHSKSKYVSIIYGDTFIPLRSEGDGLFSIDFKVPPTSVLKLGVSEDNVRYSIVLAWTVR